MSKKRFLTWILFFFLMLICIPAFAMNDQMLTAKIFGVTTVVGVSIALRVWRKQTKSLMNKKSRVSINLNDRYWLNENIPFYTKLSKSDKIIFEDRMGLFLSEITVTEVDKEMPEKETCFYVAASAIMAFWGLPYWKYGDLSEVLVYPDNFNEDKLYSSRGEIQGQVFHGGMMNATMILSLRALEHGFKNSTDKKNVGVHEFAHQLDKIDGVMDGIPAGMDSETLKIWNELAAKEIKKINANKSDINDYGGTSKVEFFAVITEYYKERPELLKKKHPQLFEVVNTYFSQDSNEKV
jgi:Mlc titration factor MtfA (ptsG expression regulator)